MKRLFFAVTALAVAWTLLLPPGQTFRAAEPANKQVKIGVVNSLFKDMPPSMIGILSRPLRSLMEAQTGVSGDLELAGDAVALATKLKNNEVQLGVFHGFEFAWARQHCPELKPIVIAVNHHPVLHAHLVVHKNCDAASAGDLKGKAIALPAMSRAHMHLYLERRCPAGDSDPKQFFSSVTRPGQPEDALDDVVDDVVQAAIVDRVALDQYQENKPGRAAKLRVLSQSEAFPASVIAYYPGSLDESLVNRCREGLVAADKSPQSKELLKMCRITNFAVVPGDYEQLLVEIAKAYPLSVQAKEDK